MRLSKDRSTTHKLPRCAISDGKCFSSSRICVRAPAPTRGMAECGIAVRAPLHFSSSHGDRCATINILQPTSPLLTRRGKSVRKAMLKRGEASWILMKHLGSFTTSPSRSQPSSHRRDGHGAMRIARHDTSAHHPSRAGRIKYPYGVGQRLSQPSLHFPGLSPALSLLFVVSAWCYTSLFTPFIRRTPPLQIFLISI